MSLYTYYATFAGQLSFFNVAKNMSFFLLTTCRFYGMMTFECVAFGVTRNLLFLRRQNYEQNKKIKPTESS